MEGKEEEKGEKAEWEEEEEVSHWGVSEDSTGIAFLQKGALLC